MTKKAYEMTDEEYRLDCEKSIKEYSDKLDKKVREAYEKCPNKDIISYEDFSTIYIFGSDNISFNPEDRHLIACEETDD